MRDTIVALSSPPAALATRTQAPYSDLGRAIVRLSGPRALPLAGAVLATTESQAGPGEQNSLYPAGTWRRVSGTIAWNGHALPAAAYLMRAPRSYTREDMAELQIPALPWAVEAVLDRLLSLGVRMAQPGEFTRRAFENGRLSLAQAEAVGALIHSLTAAEARVFSARLQSRSHDGRQEIRGEVEELLTLVELGLDFAQEDVVVVPPAEMRARVERLRARLAELLKSLGGADERLHETSNLEAGLPRIVLAGPTNAGKSSLFNALLRRNAAIVSAVQHTTRDLVEVPLTLPASGQALSALLIDTAGWQPEGRETPRNAASALPPLRQAAWDAAKTAIRDADILLLAFEAGAPLPSAGGLRGMLGESRPAARALLWTKTDLAGAPAAAAAATLDLADTPSFPISSVTGAGLEALRAFLARELETHTAQTRNAQFAAATAAREASARALCALERAGAALENGHGEDAVALELREGLHALSEAEGSLLRHDAVTEKVLDRIFSRFCVGK